MFLTNRLIWVRLRIAAPHEEVAAGDGGGAAADTAGPPEAAVSPEALRQAQAEIDSFDN